MQKDVRVLLFLLDLDGLLQLHGEIEVSDGLHEEIHRIHLVTGDGVARHVRDENQRALRIERAQLLRRLDPVHLGHLDVHEDDVAAGVVLDKIEAVQKDGDPEFLLLLFREAGDVLL